MTAADTRRALVVLCAAGATIVAACAEGRGGGGDTASADVIAVDSFIGGFDRGDTASQVLAAYLESVREAAGAPAANAPAFIVGCGADTGIVHPMEMLAAWEITGRTPRADTTVVRALTFTVAEEDAMGTTPPRYMAVERMRTNEWEWDVVRVGDRWHVCNGPRFGFVGADSNTSWRPATASHATARALAESVWQSRQPR